MLGDLGEDLSKWGYILDWMLSGSSGNSTIGYLYKSYLGAKVVILTRINGCLVFFMMWVMFAFIS